MLCRWLDLSAGAKDLVMGLLRYKPHHRLTAKQALAHPWVESRGGAVPRPLDASVGHGAANVAALRRLRNMVCRRDRACPGQQISTSSSTGSAFET